MPETYELWDRCFDATAARLAELDLDGIDLATRIYTDALQINPARAVFPCLFVSMENVGGLEPLLMDTGTDETVCPVAVHLMDAFDPMSTDSARARRWRNWQNEIATAFRARPVTGVSECWKVEARHLTALESRKAMGRSATQNTVGAVLLRFRCLTARP